jgi:hypothetical protein
MRPLFLASGLFLGVGSAVLGCSFGDADDSESIVGDLSAARAGETDLQLAKKAVALVAGTGARCNTCHTAGREEIRRWGASLRAVEDGCLASTLTLTPAERLACLREEPTDASGYTASKLGFYAAGAALPQFEDLFKQAYSSEEWQAKYEAFKEQAAMPAFGQPGFTADQFATVKSWILRGMPKLDDVLDEPGAFPCTPKTTPELVAHMAAMKTEGWGARLAAASTPMAGCGAATTATECLSAMADLTATWGAAGTPQTLRSLRQLNFRSNWWVRSSADGRYAAFGGSPSKIVDLETPGREVQVDAPYDPGFFPNNDGFSFAGTSAGGIRVCRQSVLLDALASTDHRIRFTEPGCTRIIDTVYQSVGAALDGSLFFMATGTHTNDNGGGTGPISAAFGEGATTTLTPMYNDGTKYTPGANVSVRIPFEGDQQMSPSNRLLITRFGQRAGTAGYRIRSVTPTFSSVNGATAVQVTTKELGTVCVAGGKPQLSFDERFLAVHQYTDANANPQGLPANTANIFVADLKTGKTVQVTKMGPSQKALYPHFRADGWLYFLVRDAATSKETLVGSDVALRMP